MSGVAVVRFLLTANANLIASVPVGRIVSGVLPAGVKLPAISVKSISGFPRKTVALNELKRLITERVQVTVNAETYDSQVALLVLVGLACPNRSGLVAGIDVDSIHPDIFGPDLFSVEGGGIYEQSRDFLVKWRAAT